MEKLKKIPIIGYLIRLIIAIVKLPRHIDEIYCLQKQAEDCDNRREKQNAEISFQIEELKHWNSDRMEDIRGVQKNVDSLYKTEQDIERCLTDSIEKINSLIHLQLKPEYLRKLKQKLSENYILWGDEARLHISELAAVPSCMFNTNSGEIYIGDYTFSGSGVSILAGNHDKNLKGLLRRDVELKNGCDIIIGTGVWLASNCTILGPAKIGDNSIIAAGAVVVPGTVVPANTIYGGIPAKCIGKLETGESNNIDEFSVLDALDRSSGTIFVEGWTETKKEKRDGKWIVGHFTVKDRMVIYTKKTCLKLQFYKNDEKEWKETEIVECQLDSNNIIQTKLASSNGYVEICLDQFTQEKRDVYKVVIKIDKEENSILRYFVTETM